MKGGTARLTQRDRSLPQRPPRSWHPFLGPTKRPLGPVGPAFASRFLGGDRGPELVCAQPACGSSWASHSFADKAPTGAAGEGPPAAEKDPGPPDPKKDPDPSAPKEETKAPTPEKGEGVPAQPSTSSQGPQGEGDGGGGPAEGSAGQPAALPQQTATAEASINKSSEEQGPSGSRGPEEPKMGKKAAEGQAAARRGSPAFLHSPSCPAAISR